MKNALIGLVIIVLLAAQVTAMTATVLTSKTVTRVTSVGDYSTDLIVRNDNEQAVKVGITGYDSNLEIATPLVTLEPGAEYTFHPIYHISAPLNKTYTLSISFSDENSSVSLSAKWVILSEFVIQETAPTPQPSGGSSGGGSSPRCNDIQDCMKHSNLRGCKKVDCNWCCYNDCTTLMCESEVEQEPIATPIEDNTAPEITSISASISGGGSAPVQPIEKVEVIAPEEPRSLIGYLFIGGVILGLLFVTLLLISIEKKWEEKSEKGKF
jgi:hypothetical protein